MPLPGGLSTFTLTFGTDWLVDGSDQAFPGMTGTLSVSPPIVDTATGESLIGDIDFVIGNDGTASIGPLVHNDDPGINQGTQYTVTWKALSYKKTPGVKTFVVPMASGSTVPYNSLRSVDGTTSAPYVLPLVTSVAGRSGAVTLAKGDVGLGNVDNTADAAKPISTAQATALAGKANITDLKAAFAPSIPPSMTLYEHQTDTTKNILMQVGATLYAAGQTTTGQIYKSADKGASWASKGTTGFKVKVLLQVQKTATLIAVEDTDTTTAGLNPKVARSIDDGTTWTQVSTLNFPPLAQQGITETPGGNILIGEYGNVGNTSYRVRLSTDDGLTWSTVLSSPGTDIANDPGHIHSVTWDPFAGKLVAFMDRPNPELYQSANEGATWTKIGTSTTLDMPNFVVPLHFQDYIAWGYDDNNNGQFARILRSDFYAGNWGPAYIQKTAQVNRKAFYHAFPIRTDLWALSGASELIGSEPLGPGDYGVEVFLVSGNGAQVTGGFSYSAVNVQLAAALKGYKATFPTRKWDVLDHGGESWLNLPNVSSTFAAVPYSAGIRPQMRATPSGSIGPFVVPNNAGLQSPDTNAVRRTILNYDTNNRARLRNPFNAATPEFVAYEDGTCAVLVSGTIVMKWTGNPGSFTNGNAVFHGTTNAAPSNRAGAGSPEGVVAAAVGSTYFRTDGGAGTSFYVKESGTGNTGWVGK